MKNYDFGFRNHTLPFENANIALLFQCDHDKSGIGVVHGPGAVLDASRHIELFEMQVGSSPMDLAPYCAFTQAEQEFDKMREKYAAAIKQGKTPIVISRNRQFTTSLTASNAVVFWGKLGRKEADEPPFIKQTHSVLAGMRAASSIIFQGVPPETTIIPCEQLLKTPEILKTGVANLNRPVHVSIDLDVLAPEVAQNDRTIEPGGLDWYMLLDLIGYVNEHPGIQSIDITGCNTVRPHGPTAMLLAQLIIRLMGMLELTRQERQ